MNWINKVLSSFGVGIHRVQKNSSGNSIPHYQTWISNWQIKTVIDIGANEGQFAKEIIHLFPDCQLHSIEAIPEIANKLRQNLQTVENAVVYEVGVGPDEIDEKTFYQNDFSQSSSFLPTSEHKEHFPETSNTTPIKIRQTTIDKLFSQTKLTKPVLYKIDVQGYELEVLKGSIETLKLVDYIKCELSFKSLYKDQSEFDDVYEFLKSQNFILIGFTHILNDPKTGLPLQVDGYFKRI